MECVRVFQEGLHEDIEILASWWMERKEALRFEETISSYCLLGMDKAYDFFWNAMAVVQVFRCITLDSRASVEVASVEEKEVIACSVGNTAEA